MIFQGVLLLIVVISFANFDSLMARFDETLTESAAGRGRSAIWADAGRLARDFAITGTGAGTFGTAIAVYQTAEPGYSIGQAHNHYLQIAAEGGALVGVPAALVVVAFLLLFLTGMKEDQTSDHLMRAGAGAGLAGVMLQSFWETGLRMPANAMLFAVLAAIAIHSPVLAPRVRNQTN
jgi:putative inorganic carbon (hco3(-)) transporter